MATNKFETMRLNISNKFSNMSLAGWLVLGTVVLFSVVLNGYLIWNNMNLSQKLTASRTQHKKEIERATEQYNVVHVENANLKKRLQNMDLRLAETLNLLGQLTALVSNVNAETRESIRKITNMLTESIKKTNQEMNKLKQDIDNAEKFRKKQPPVNN